MADATAAIRFELQNAEQVLQILRELNAATSGSGGTAVAPPGGGGGVPNAAHPATPLLTQQPVPPSGAGTPEAGTRLSQQLAEAAAQAAQPLPPTAPAVPPVVAPQSHQAAVAAAASQPGARSASLAGQVGAILGGSVAYHQLLGAVESAGGLYGEAVASGREFHWRRLIPAGVQLAGTTGGAILGGVIGSVIPGAGTLVGAAVGSAALGTVASVINSYLGPLQERAISNERLAAVTGVELDLNTQVGAVAMGAYLSGVPIPAPAFQTVQQNLKPALMGEGASAYARLRYTPAAYRALGPLGAGLSPAEMREDMLRTAEAAVWSDPGGAVTLAAAIEEGGARSRRIIETARQNALFQGQMRDQMELLGVQQSAASLRMSIAGRYEGSAGLQAAAPAVQASMRAQAALQRQAAERIPDPLARQATLLHAEMLETQAALVPQAVLEARTAEFRAEAGLRAGRAERELQRALYAGRPAGELPYGSIAAERRRLAAGIERDIAERAAAGMPYSPAELAALRNEIEAARFEADVTVPRMAEQARFGEMQAETGLATAQETRRRIGPILRGGVFAGLEQYDLQARALERQEQTLRTMLDTARLLTREERTRLETQIAQLQTDRERLAVQRDYAASSAREQVAGTRMALGAAELAQRRVYGTATYQEGQAITAAEASIAASRASFYAAEDRRLAAAGYAEDDPRRMALQRMAADARTQQAAAERALARVDVPDAVRGRSALLQAQEAIASMGYGRFGDIRQAQLGQAQIAAERLAEVRRRRAELGAAGRLTPAMAADLDEQEAQAALAAAAAVQRYDEGFDGRLISQTLNAGGPAFAVFRARYSRRDAVLAMLEEGLPAPRSMGGPYEIALRHRMQAGRMMGALGSGDPSWGAERLIGGAAERPVQVNVSVRVEDATVGGRIRAVPGTVEGWNAASTTVNWDAAQR